MAMADLIRRIEILAISVFCAASVSAAANLDTLSPVCQTTTLMTNGRAPVILAPTDGAGLSAAQKLRSALKQRLGVEPVVCSRLTETSPGQATVIALGNMLDNELLTRLYWSRYCYEDAQFPGPDGYTVHTVYDPHPWGGGQNVIVLGANRPEQLDKGVERFLSLLEGVGQATVLPYVMIVEPSPKLTAAVRAKALAKPVDPSFTAFRSNAEQYLKSGEETYARQAIRALDIMVETYRKNPGRHTPWPEETTSGPIFAAWDAFEECPLITPDKRREYLQAWLLWSRDLTRCSYEYRLIDERFSVTWNHTTFALLGLYYAGRYFDRHYGLAEAKEWLRRARLGFAAQARSWKPQEDADSYLVLTMGHTIEYSLADWDLRFFEHGLINRYADYVVGCGDNRQWPAGFGDSGYSSQPTMAMAALPVAYWWTRDSGYRWILEHTASKGWKNPYWSAVAPRVPERFVGLNVFPLDRQIYDDTQRRPTYGEAFEKADVTFDAAWDKISFRENWDADGQYLLLDGLGRGKHLHFDTNSIATFVQDGERWLLDHDYLVRNTTEHTMLSVLRDGRSTKLVPSLAGLAVRGDLHAMATTHTYVKNYNGVDWDRRVLWSKGNWFLVEDTITAHEVGHYDLDLTWKTIDRGHQQVDAAGRFLAQRPNASKASQGKTTTAAPSARAASEPVAACHIDPAVPVRAWVTNHVRQGIAVPVSVLHQRQSVDCMTGDSATFCSLLYATGAKHPDQFTVGALRPRVFRVTSDKESAAAGFGADQAGAWQCDAESWLVAGQTVSLVGAHGIRLGKTGLKFSPAANVSLDVRDGRMTLIAAQPTMVTAEGSVSVDAKRQLSLPVGTHTLAVKNLEKAVLQDVHRGTSPTVGPAQPMAKASPGSKPLWNAQLAVGSPVTRITPADIDHDGQMELLVACGSAGHAVRSNGELLWSYGTAGVVRDVSCAHFTKNGPATILVSSADTYLHQLDPAGRLVRKDQMIGLYFNVDHGERPWGLYCTRAVDTNADGVDDLLVTTLASMESQGLTPEGKTLWRTLAAYHGCMEMTVEDVDHDGKPEIVIANKYGAVYVLRPDGSKLLNSSTSIGDEAFGLGDLNGDGHLEIVHGSSTGDLIAVDLKNKLLWRFDNYGYPVERIRCVDVTGDGRPEVLIASGTGYVYCLDAGGTLLWQRRLGLAVHDLIFAAGVVCAGTEDGEVHALDAAGKIVWSQSLGAAVTKLATLSVEGRAAIVAGLADGRLVALPVK